MKKKGIVTLFAVIAAFVILGMVSMVSSEASGRSLCFEQEPTNMPAPTLTNLPTPIPTDPPVLTSTPTPTPTNSPTPVPTNTPTPTSTPTPTPDVVKESFFTGKSYMVVDLETEEVILSYQSDMQIYPASTLKLLTALTVLDHAEPDILLTAEEEILRAIDPEAAQMGVPAGTTYSLEVWLHLLLIRSYADAADTIAAGTAGSLEQFTVWMNEYAAGLGLTATSVDNAIGLDYVDGFDKTYSTAGEMMQILIAAMKNPTVREITSKASYQVPATDGIYSHTIYNSNLLLTHPKEYGSELFTAVAGKTGFTTPAGQCLAAVVLGADGHEYACVYYGGISKWSVAQEIVKLFECAIKKNME
ncbi:MAG: D-alanyl-D-alanine carboxypeptidase [Lachnospiraceae bacterium]|nr:D-alanyl-D-alanine carboxypeptidase [Lachnospiraceae bacterium]